MSEARAVSNHNLELDDNLLINLSDGVDEALQKMAKVECVFEKAFTAANWTPPVGLSVFLDVESPPSRGQIRFHFSHDSLAKLYNNIMELVTVPDQSQVLDCLGEISNVTYGLAKIKMNERGFALNMALPHSGKTEDLPNLEVARTKTVIPFKIFDQVCYIEILVLAN